jgi:hypothetical protein
MNSTEKNPIHEGATIASLLHNWMLHNGLGEAAAAELLAVDHGGTRRAATR